MAHPLPSLLMAVLAPPPLPYPGAPPEPDPHLEADVRKWVGRSKPKKELMLQALYAALPYAFTDDEAALAVGRLLAQAVGGVHAALPPDAEGIQALRKELREELRKRFDKLRANIP